MLNNLRYLIQLMESRFMKWNGLLSGVKGVYRKVLQELRYIRLVLVFSFCLVIFGLRIKCEH